MKDLIKATAKKLDDLVPFDKWFGGIVGNAAEWGDRRLFELSLEFAISKVPEEYHDEIKVVLTAFVNNDVQALRGIDITQVAEHIKTPLGDRKEKIILGRVVDMVFDLIEDEVHTANSDPGGGPTDPRDDD